MNAFPEPTQREFEQALEEALLNRANRAGDSEVGEVNMEAPLLWAGQSWENVKLCRTALRMYAARNKFEPKMKKNNALKIIAICSAPNCTFRVYCRKAPSGNAMRLRSCNLEHNCNSDISGKNPTLNANIIAEILVQEIREHCRQFKASEVKQDIWRSKQIKISYAKAHRALGKALEMVNGNYEDPTRLSLSFVFRL